MDEMGGSMRRPMTVFMLELQLLLCLTHLFSKMIIPLGPEAGRQTLDLVEKEREGKVTKTKLMGARYVPQCEKRYQLNLK